MFKVIMLLAFVPMTLLLAISFFVLFAVQRAAGNKTLQVFGLAVAACLWASAALMGLGGLVGVYNIGEYHEKWHDTFSRLTHLWNLCAPKARPVPVDKR